MRRRSPMPRPVPRFEWFAGRIPINQRKTGVYISDGGDGCWTPIRDLDLAIRDFLATAYYEKTRRCKASLHINGLLTSCRVFLYQPKRRP